MPNNIKPWFWGTFTVLLAILIINVVFFVIPAIAQFGRSFTPARTLTVSAQGKTTATPDLAEITFSVVTQGKNPADLTTNDDQKSTAIAQFLASENIATSDIATTNYSLSPNYQYDRTTQRNYIVGYTLTDTVRVKIRDLTNVASVLGGLAPLGVNQVGDVNFTFSDPDNLVGPARDQAIQKAEEKAAEIAAESGASLGRIVNISESGNVPQPMPYMAYGGVEVSSAMAVPTPTINAGTQDITDSVTITYELR